MQGDKYSIDMCSGPIFSKIILFSVPLILSGILQLMFNAADLIVLGRFASPEAMAAVGATAFLTNLSVNVFIGLSIGTNVLAANYLGAKNWKNTSRTVHTAIAVSLAGGVALAVIGILISKPLLEMMSTPDDIIGMATLYMWIYCAGLPFILLYNFGSAVMRAAGDTRRPLFYLVIAGIVNVILNIVFVLGLHIDVAGVAIATDHSEEHAVDRAPGGNPGLVLLDFKPCDPVVHQLVRSYGDCGNNRRAQPRRNRLRRSIFVSSDRNHICWTEHRRRTRGPRKEEHLVLSDLLDCA